MFESSISTYLLSLWLFSTTSDRMALQMSRVVLEEYVGFKCISFLQQNSQEYYKNTIIIRYLKGHIPCIETFRIVLIEMKSSQ